MNFALNSEQQMFQQMFADFAAGEVAARAEESDRLEELPRELLQKAAELGFLAALIPEEAGGAGLDMISYCLMLEAVGKADMNTAIALSVHNDLVIQPIIDQGSMEQQAAYLEPMSTGEMIGAFALTEPGAGSDISALQTRAERTNGDIILNGCKTWVTNGGLAGLFLVFARTEHGIDAYLTPRDSAGLKIGYREKTLGLRGLHFNTIYFDDCRIPATCRLGAEGQGKAILKAAIDYDRLALAAISLGGAERALAEGVSFSAEHDQFGGPIAHKQAIQNFIADTAVDIEALRYMVYHTAWLADEGRPFGHAASMAKLLGSEVAMRAADRMLQVHGGYGYMKEYAVERLYRDCRALEIMCGTSQIQRFLIARKVYQEQGISIQA